MWRGRILLRGYVYSHTQLKKVGDSPYPYPINAGFSIKTGTSSNNIHEIGLFVVSNWMLISHETCLIQSLLEYVQFDKLLLIIKIQSRFGLLSYCFSIILI